ncbi:MAG: Zn-ribbon domain-containing OB-fold protein [Minwuia sp.]|nr:Zn-ribbon domain-containing OB-fold protein [Minwuia sp.]
MSRETPTTAPATDLPLPPPNAESQAFWDAARDGHLLLTRCTACDAVQFPPQHSCTACGGTTGNPFTASGTGEIFTFTINHRAPSPAFKARAPYIIALVDLAEGPRLMMNVINCAPEDVKIGMTVKIVFEARGDMALPQAELV